MKLYVSRLSLDRRRLRPQPPPVRATFSKCGQHPQTSGRPPPLVRCSDDISGTLRRHVAKRQQCRHFNDATSWETSRHYGDAVRRVGEMSRCVVCIDKKTKEISGTGATKLRRDFGISLRFAHCREALLSGFKIMMSVGLDGFK